MDKFNQLENYMLGQIAKINLQLDATERAKNYFSKEDYIRVVSMLNGQKDILYKCLTAYDNTYNQDSQRKVSGTA